MTIVSLHVGMPRRLPRDTGALFTGGAKTAVEHAVLRFDGFEGDGQANRKHHGGPDRTACVYPADHYAWWSAKHGLALSPGAFSENLTVEGALETEICIGDVWGIGSAQAQVTLPRDPCRTIDRVTEVSGLHNLARESGRCGFHLRTITEGTVRVGDRVSLIDRHPAGVTVAAVLDLYHGRSDDRDLLGRLLDMSVFAEEGKRELRRRM